MAAFFTAHNTDIITILTSNTVAVGTNLRFRNLSLGLLFYLTGTAAFGTGALTAAVGAGPCAVTGGAGVVSIITL